MFHHYTTSIEGIELPEKFTCPFYYTPHPLCMIAAGEVQKYLCSQSQWKEELAEGKMFGVLVVQTESGEIGYLAAFSGNLAHENKHPFFVPPIFDLLDPQGFFVAEEAEISAINKQISRLEEASDYVRLKEMLAAEEVVGVQKIVAVKMQFKQAKLERDRRRKLYPDEQTQAAMIRESQFQKAELKRMERLHQERIGELKQQLVVFEEKIEQKKAERAARSFALQKRLFDSYRIQNAQGEEIGLYTLFEQSLGKLPPAGGGECAAPKLLQYAYKNNLHPLIMAEFWWQPSGNVENVNSVTLPQNVQSELQVLVSCVEQKKYPRESFRFRSSANELRRHGCFYPACKSKCEPILTFMMQGLTIENNPLTMPVEIPGKSIEMNDFLLVSESEGEMMGDADLFARLIVYEDEWLVVVNKPAGLLSVPGKSDVPSVYSLMKMRYPKATGPLIVHRLDMDTSGLLILAKTKEVHKVLQKMFVAGSVKNEDVVMADECDECGECGECRSSEQQRNHPVVFVKKGYIALLDGVLNENNEAGEILLPLCLDPTDRPRQMVSVEYGKPAVTRYRILKRTDKHTFIAFYPLTGRTHQLRVHAAHPDGLNTPIVGDRLYGKPAERLCLHAQSLTFTHPVTGEKICLEAQANFPEYQD